MSTTAVLPIEQLLLDRGQNPETFLNPHLNQLHDPFLFKGMREAVDLAHKAKNFNWKVRIMGDYDTDGISSTYILMHLLNEAGINVSYDIPNRKDGYGFNKDMVDRAYRDGCKLLITCDNGIVAVEEVRYAKELGMEVIITDHHEPQEVLPDCVIVNHKQEGCPYPFKELCGAGVAWKFCHAFLTELKMNHKILDVIEVVATGTVADMMDLVDENRVIVSFGLQAYKNTRIKGLDQLVKEMGADKYPITSETIGYSIGPAFNAAGRLVHANEGVELLLEKSPLKSLRTARYLNDLNEERKEWTKYYSELIINDVKDTTDKVIVYKEPSIPEGIVGIIAARVMNELHRPVLLMTLDETGEFYKGSGRSIPGYDLFANMMNHKDLFIKAGGHEMACGFSMKAENIIPLWEALNDECTLTEEQMKRKVIIDYDIDEAQVTFDFAEDLKKLEPYGKGNPKPLFQMQNCKVLTYQYIGKDKKTLKLKVQCGYEMFECIGFNMADKFERLEMDNGFATTMFIDIAFYPGINEWNKKKTLQLELKDIQVS